MSTDSSQYVIAVSQQKNPHCRELSDILSLECGFIYDKKSRKSFPTSLIQACQHIRQRYQSCFLNKFFTVEHILLPVIGILSDYVGSSRYVKLLFWLRKEYFPWESSV